MTDASRDDGDGRSEDETSDVPPSETPLPQRATLFGLTLAAAAVLPLAPDGRRFVDFIAESFRRSILEGILTTIGLGSPFLFGLAVAVGSALMRPEHAARLVRAPLSVLHSQLILVAGAVWLGGDALAALPLFGFSIVSGIFFAVHLASARASGHGPSFRWLVRWGAMMVLAIAAWARLQMFDGVSYGWGLSVVLASAAMLLRATAPEP